MNDLAPIQPSPIVRYVEMCAAIRAAYEVDEVKDIRDKALAIQTYAQQANNEEAERQAREIRLRAERRAGELLTEMEKAKPGRRPANPSQATRDIKPLAELGISYDQSSRWQKLAAIPEAEFEASLTDPEVKPTTAGIIAKHAEPTKDTVDPRALWLWGRLKDFEREGLLSANPNDLLATMLDHMQGTTRELAPEVAAWLGRIRQ